MHLISKQKANTTKVFLKDVFQTHHRLQKHCKIEQFWEESTSTTCTHSKTDYLKWLCQKLLLAI